jgi:hypothetical protein
MATVYETVYSSGTQEVKEVIAAPAIQIKAVAAGNIEYIYLRAAKQAFESSEIKHTLAGYILVITAR